MSIMESVPIFEWVDVDKIMPSAYQPRQWFAEEGIQELASSIALHGILQPLVLESNYQLIAGERRLRAAKFIGLKEVPCMILKVSHGQHALMSILENIQREGIEPLEEALALQKLQKEFAWTQEYIAKMLGKSRPYVSNILRLLKLTQVVQDGLNEKVLSYGHAKILVGLPEEEQIRFFNHLKKHSCNVRQFEKMVSQSKKPPCRGMPEDEHFIQSMMEQVGTEVKLEQLSNGEGWLKFKFFNQDNLVGLLERLGLSYD
ncbi:MAG: ParB/RepB/Spo0J family partition protein [Gammaproteobacteria bacterium]|nr:ParB/RepB/Spo0J family partition protein [Gammaproteobacteria bacterium]